MSDLLPIILIALGSALLLTQRDVRIGLGAFLVQWLGIAWIVWSSTAPGAGSYPATIEIVTAIITVTIMALTVFRPASSAPAKAAPRSQRSIQDWLWLWGLALLVGVAGYGLTRVTTLGVPQNSMLAFYWIVLASMLLIVLEGSRSAVKLGLAVLSLANAACLFLYLIAVSPQETGILGASAIARLVLGVLVSYLWYILASRYNTQDFNTLFDKGDGIAPINTNTGLVIVQDKATIPTSAASSSDDFDESAEEAEPDE